jgi:hypothetical protein
MDERVNEKGLKRVLVLAFHGRAAAVSTLSRSKGVARNRHKPPFRDLPP